MKKENTIKVKVHKIKYINFNLILAKMIIMQYFATFGKKKEKIFDPPLTPSNEGNQEELPPYKWIWPPLYVLKSFHINKMRRFTKN